MHDDMSTQRATHEAGRREPEGGCGVMLGETHPVECGKVDAFGVRQYCHRCNGRVYTARQARATIHQGFPMTLPPQSPESAPIPSDMAEKCGNCGHPHFDHDGMKMRGRCRHDCHCRHFKRPHPLPASSRSGEAERGEPEAPYEHPLEPTGRITATTRWVELPSDLPDDSAPSLPEGDDGEDLDELLGELSRAVEEETKCYERGYRAGVSRARQQAAEARNAIRAMFRAAAARLTELEGEVRGLNAGLDGARKAADREHDLRCESQSQAARAGKALEKIVAYIDVSGDRDDNPEDCINDVSEMAKVAVSEMAKAALTSLRSGGGA